MMRMRRKKKKKTERQKCSKVIVTNKIPFLLYLYRKIRGLRESGIQKRMTWDSQMKLGLKDPEEITNDPSNNDSTTSV